MFFPFDKLRPYQEEMIEVIDEAIRLGQDAIIHAPTGLGKTAASLAPCITYAKEHNKTVFFLTSRHTQHRIAFETIEALKKKHDIDLITTTIVGKKNLCLQDGITNLPASEFLHYCKTLCEHKQCPYFERMKGSNSLSTAANDALAKLRLLPRTDTQAFLDVGRAFQLCPYELSIVYARKAHVIIADYYYVFHPRIQENFFARINKELEDAILIIDEGHNLPDRIKDLASVQLTSQMVSRAIKEAKKYRFDELDRYLLAIEGFFTKKARLVEEESFVSQEEFSAVISQLGDYEEFVSLLDKRADIVREEQRISYLGSLANFLDEWLGEDAGFARILSKESSAQGPTYVLRYACLDPSLIGKKVIGQVRTAILMSGTLEPTKMYERLLGFESPLHRVFPSPFLASHRLSLVVPKTSTKFTSRSDQQYSDIAKELTKLCEVIQGNVAIFFPSYALLKQVASHFSHATSKTVFEEHQQLTTPEKNDLLERFKSYKDVGAVLLGVIGGNFSEGIDLPGNFLNGVIIVGLPLGKPTFETKALIEYYNKRFKKGWDYGYVLPAFNKAMQSAGRCIRSTTDRGVIIFLDERYEWTRYYELFPKTWKVRIAPDYEQLIRDFFASHKA
ncbi:MAG: ATP-dependent DNA helicase [Candidatus Woesearchaeota archaeon]|nr:MAG: ATP-dependent DNA helicase [Candidatus Woesearchaeota archaeon]